MSASSRRLAPNVPSEEPVADGTGSVDERVYEAISRALLSGKLRPGTPLRERALAEALDCTRGAVRKVLARLGTEKRLILEHNRGAFVPNPTVEEMRSIYRARRIVEAGLVTSLCGRLSSTQIEVLQRHVQAEQQALEEGRRADSIRLAGEFHLVLAQMAGSDELLSYIQRLVATTELYKALFDSVAATACAPREHQEIINALLGGALDKALAVAMTHLDELEQRVIAGAVVEREVDLVTLLTKEGGAALCANMNA
ncbi:GntR family transcriptional regulator [Comamonas thiooxydans]|uniref:GntR family transcriptional regulator n=1 Tax=Comamonas thiooxydans TaxID=363952 RepID=UPI000A2DA8BF|nr:GntR family transcriptional regulator [Comamonas thiooxydans]BDR08954.1 GntR family transcriptional regulator [Comamonas thiooxydans]